MIAGKEENMPLRETEKHRFFYGYIVALAAFIMMTVSWGAYYCYGVFFEPLLAEFGWTRAVISGAFSISVFIQGICSIVAGKLTDRFGSRVVDTACGFLLGLGFILVSRVETVWQLYLVYGALIGVGMSGFWSPLTSTVARWFVVRRGMMTGIVVSGLGLGVMVIPPLATRFISIYGWRFSYVILGIIALVIILIAAQFLKRNTTGQTGQPALAGDSIRRTKDYSLTEAIHTRQFWMLCAIYFCFGVSLLTITVHIVPHVMGLGISATDAASILAALGGTSIVGRLVMGSVSDKVGAKLSLMIPLIFMSLSMFSVLVIKEVWAFYLFSTALGFAYGGLAAVQSLVVAELFGLGAVGVIVGILVFWYLTGGAVGPFMSGYIFDVTGSYSLAFLTCAILCGMAIILTLFLTPLSRERSSGLNPGS